MLRVSGLGFGRRWLACVGAWAMVGVMGTACAAAETWREVDSPHFKVITDGSERDGRDVAKQMEQMRGVFVLRFRNPTLETGAPLVIFAVREQGLHELGEPIWKTHNYLAGEFFRKWEKQFAFVRLDEGVLNGTVVFHEYTHSVLHANLQWLPTWLDEGLAEFYAYTRFEGDKTYVGAPSVRYGHLKNAPLIPVAEMLTLKESSFIKDTQKSEVFYGEAWAMVHYMTFGPEMEGGAKLDRLIALLQQRTPELTAFQQVFGDPKAFERGLQLYLMRLAMTAGVMPAAEHLDAKAYPAKVLTEAEVEYELGSLDVAMGDAREGRPRLEAAEAADPALAGPHEELGFLAWRQGRDADAKAEWQKAVAADPGRYRAAFALLMSGTPLRAQSTAQLQATGQALGEIEKEAPKYAPAVVETALVEWRMGQLNQAYKSAVAAEKLEPWRAGYRLLAGWILLKGKQPKLAAEEARNVADRWAGSDHDEAVDLWNSVPKDMRGDGPPLTLDLPQGATVVRGRIANTACGKASFSVTVTPEDAPDVPVVLAASGPYESGFSDTLWVGEDHYTSCFHLAGLPVVAAYTDDGAGSRKLLALEVRDDLP